MTNVNSPFIRPRRASLPEQAKPVKLASATLEENVPVFTQNKPAPVLPEKMPNDSDLLEGYTRIEPKDVSIGPMRQYPVCQFKTKSGVEYTLPRGVDTENIFVYENENTEPHEVIIIGAQGGEIRTSSEDVSLTIYDSEDIDITTNSGDDNITIYDSKVKRIVTYEGTDTVGIKGNSQVGSIDTGLGEDFIEVEESIVDNIDTSGGWIFGALDSGDDITVVNNSDVEEVLTGGGDDNTVIANSSVEFLDTGSGQDATSLRDSELTTTQGNELTVENGNYLDFDKSKVLEIESEVEIPLEDGTSISVADYMNFSLNQEMGFETEEEYQLYAVNILATNFQNMQEIFSMQNEKDGDISKRYNVLKELTGLGISDKDIQQMLDEQEEMMNAFNQVLNGESDETFEEVFERYTKVPYSKEKLDKYMEVYNTYTSLMVASQYDENYPIKFEEATGKTIDDVAREFALVQIETFGKNEQLQNLAEKYQLDQNTFADKLSSMMSTTGMLCMVVGSVLTFIPATSLVGSGLLTFGRGLSISGMAVDNVLDFKDDATDSDGLTKEEFGNFLLESAVDVGSFYLGSKIGKFTQGLNSSVTSKATQMGLGKTSSWLLGQTTETLTDTALSLGADFLIAQGESLIREGKFIPMEIYWSKERFLGEGQNQLLGILTGVASSKIEANQANALSSASIKIISGDLDGAKLDLNKAGIKFDDENFNAFAKQIGTEEAIRHDIETEAARTTQGETETPRTTQGENPQVEVSGDNPKMLADTEIEPNPQTEAARTTQGETETPRTTQGETEEPRTTQGETEVNPEFEMNLQLFGAKHSTEEVTIDKLKDDKLPSDVNRALGENAFKLNDEYEHYIDEATKQIEDGFNDVPGVIKVTGRAKGIKSTFEKLANKFKKGKIKTTSVEDSLKAIGDAYGTRIQMQPLSVEQSRKIILEEFQGTDVTPEDFSKYLRGKLKNQTEFDLTPQKLQAIEQKEHIVLKALKQAQTEPVVSKMIELISRENDPLVLTELNNYGNDGSSYFTPEQLCRIAEAHYNKTGERLTIITKLDETLLGTAVISAGKDKRLVAQDVKQEKVDGKIVTTVTTENGEYTDKNAVKASGYTTSQMNVVHTFDDGTVGYGELQIRGNYVNSFADAEHIPYDIRQGKIKDTETKYADVYKVIKGMDGKVFDAYNEYLTAVYDSMRLKELGFEGIEQPNIREYISESDIPDSVINLLTPEGLIEISNRK